MLINFSFSNWMSFKKEASFSMTASRKLQHQQHLTKLPKYNTQILPISAIYGGNASGKSNFFKALEFCQNFILFGPPLDTPNIYLNAFYLDKESYKNPSSFSFDLLIDDSIYNFAFTLTKQKF